ncbi:putative transcriptional regulator, AsnC family protein [Leucobacter sp. Psy1]|uniref:Lrp/AsnC family transcriptional regulator n=1 Tax=Leucobacter sp. Psy1 TaxID=2875729 RepID=UPI001CD81329|nr:Lrp/AsnC family transcriptional regulator [Leucobacter sp. Psy1]UBH05776.1 putative transcriptional regulator, AsnC family protein [Leucobacter sp. Psy1]
MENSKNLQGQVDLDEIDRNIIAELQANGRVTNAELAERVGVAASTCIARVRSLVSRKIITGFTATVDPRALGIGLQVLISVTVRSGARQGIMALSDELRALPEVMELYFLGGVEDFIVHLAARDADHVRDFVVEHLSAHPAVSSTRTSIVFHHYQNPVRPL